MTNLEYIRSSHYAPADALNIFKSMKEKNKTAAPDFWTWLNESREQKFKYGTIIVWSEGGCIHQTYVVIGIDLKNRIYTLRPCVRFALSDSSCDIIKNIDNIDSTAIVVGHITSHFGCE